MIVLQSKKGVDLKVGIITIFVTISFTQNIEQYL